MNFEKGDKVTAKVGKKSYPAIVLCSASQNTYWLKLAMMDLGQVWHVFNTEAPVPGAKLQRRMGEIPNLDTD